METETIVVRTTPVVLSTWTQIFRMDRFRTILGDGFMNHLEENKNLMHIFDYFVDTKLPIVQTMTKQERVSATLDFIYNSCLLISFSIIFYRGYLNQRQPSTTQKQEISLEQSESTRWVTQRSNLPSLGLYLYFYVLI